MPAGAFRALGQILDRVNDCSCICNTLAIYGSRYAVLCATCRLVSVWQPWSVVAWQQIFVHVRSCDLYAGSCSSIVPTCCCADDLQDTRYFMELICSVPAEPLHADFGTGQQCWQSKSGEQLQGSCSCTLLWLQGSQAVNLWGSCSILQVYYAIAGCSNDLCSIG